MLCCESWSAGGDVRFGWCKVKRASSVCITYVPCPDATPEGERAALAAVYKFLLNRRIDRDATNRCDTSQTGKEASNETLRR